VQEKGEGDEKSYQVLERAREFAYRQWKRERERDEFPLEQHNWKPYSACFQICVCFCTKKGNVLREREREIGHHQNKRRTRTREELSIHIIHQEVEERERERKKKRQRKRCICLQKSLHQK